MALLQLDMNILLRRVTDTEIRAMQTMRKPKLFWVSAGAPLVSVILSTLVVFASKANNHGITVVSY